MFGSGGMSLITTIVGFGMSATFIVFVCTRLICGRLRGGESNRMFEVETRADLEQPEHHGSGLEPIVVAAIPTMKFDREAFGDTKDAQCAICLGEYQDKEVLRIMPKCSHSFHLSCIDVWLRKQSTCPVCRLPLQESLGHITSAADESSEFSIVQSRQWLLPLGERSVGIGSSNRSANEPIRRNQELAPHVVEAETR